MEWRLFADIAERAGDRRISVTVDPDATVGDALAALFEVRPELRERVLVDGSTELRASVTLLRDGDPVEDLDAPISGATELALLPPASGG